jgi:hypothetical protein
LKAGGTSKVTVPINKLTGNLTSKITWKNRLSRRHGLPDQDHRRHEGVDRRGQEDRQGR